MSDNLNGRDGDQAIFDQYLRVLPVISELLDICLLMVDREKYLFVKSSTNYTVTAIECGSSLKPGALGKAMAEKRRIVSRIDKATVGTRVSLYSSATPIFNDENDVIGALAAVESVERQEAVRDMAVELTQAISTLASNTEEVSAQSQEISGVSQELVNKVTDAAARVRETNQVLELIKGIAGQTNLLGLNAAIEAARVGDQGRGFGVVAQEIRKLADSTSESIKKIDGVIKSVQADSEYNRRQLEYIVQAVSQIASAVSDTANTVQKTSGLAVKLNEMADDMFKNK